jgi:hypothetical protein
MPCYRKKRARIKGTENVEGKGNAKYKAEEKRNEEEIYWNEKNKL